MSSTTAVSTADQPNHALANVTAHPGSSWAGLGVIVVGVISSVVMADGFPTTKASLAVFLGSVLTGVLAALGK